MNRSFCRSRLIAHLALLSLAPVAGAQTKTQDAAQALDAIVVVGAMTDVELDREAIERRQAATLADLFSGVPSVSVGGGVGIAQKIYVRGLEDSVLNVTVDGAPQRGTLFHHVGRVSIEPELLESVDVQAGAGEATSGFGAIGGAIRFRTRDATALLEEGEDIGGIVKLSWASNDARRHSATTFARLTGDIGLLASHVDVDSDDYRDGDGRTLRGTGARQRLGFVKLGGDLNEAQRLTVSYEQRREEGAFGQRPNWPVLDGQALFPVSAERGTAVLNYGHLIGDTFELEATAYSTRTDFEQDRFDRWGRYGAMIDTRGGDLRGTLRTDAHRLVFGIESRNDSVVGQYLGPASQWQPWAWDPAVGRVSESGDVLGIYVQDHWFATDALLVSVGARHDVYDLALDTYGGGTDSAGTSFNGGLSYNLSEHWTLNLSYAEAFRGKEIGDAFTLEKRPGRIGLAPGLRPETVDNAEFGAEYARGGFSASAVYFEMTINDVILDQLGNGPAPQAGTYYENVGRFRSEGVEFRVGYDIGPFGVDAFYNHYDSRLNGRRIEGYEHIALGNSLGDNWHLGLRYEPDAPFALEATLARVEALNDIEVLFREVELGFIDSTRRVDKPGYTVVDLFAQWAPFASRKLELTAGVYNLFDRSYRSHASVADYRGIPGYGIVAGLNELGRNLRLGASYRF